MKFAVGILALVATTLPSAVSGQSTCRNKKGQLSYIKELSAQWTLYNKQVASNLAISAEQEVYSSNRKAQEIGEDNKKAAKNAKTKTRNENEKKRNKDDLDDADASLDAELAAAEAAADAEAAAKLAETEAADARQEEVIDGSIAVLQGRKAAVEANRQTQKAKAVERKNKRKSDAAANLSAEEAALAASKQAKIDVQNSGRNSKKGTFSSGQASKTAEVEAQFAQAIADLEASKYDVAATLAELDNAGGTGLTYPADCIMDVADVVTLVKQGRSAKEIWEDIILPNA